MNSLDHVPSDTVQTLNIYAALLYFSRVIFLASGRAVT